MRFVFNNFFLNRVLHEIMWQNIAEQDRPQMAIWRMSIVCLKTKATHTLRICNTYCFSTTTIVTRTRPIVRLYLHCLSY
jgi:hypothetical protein